MNVPIIITLLILGFIGVQYVRYRICTKDYSRLIPSSGISSNSHADSELLRKLVVFRRLQDSIHNEMSLTELIDAFAQMCAIPVGDPDDLLFEAGHYRIGKEVHFLFSLVRQFKFRSGDEYVQLKLSIQYPHRPILWWLYATRWSMDIRGDFFDYIKSHLIFRLFKNVQFSDIEITIDET